MYFCSLCRDTAVINTPISVGSKWLLNKISCQSCGNYVIEMTLHAELTKISPDIDPNHFMGINSIKRAAEAYQYVKEKFSGYTPIIFDFCDEITAERFENSAKDWYCQEKLILLDYPTLVHLLDKEEGKELFVPLLIN